jgi:hypothetical protein
MFSTYKDNLTIDRIDNNGNYCKENCRWVDAKKQANNRSTNILYKYNNQTKTLKEWCELLGKNYKKVWQRIHRNNWSFKKAINL